MATLKIAKGKINFPALFGLPEKPEMSFRWDPNGYGVGGRDGYVYDQVWWGGNGEQIEFGWDSSEIVGNEKKVLFIFEKYLQVLEAAHTATITVIYDHALTDEADDWETVYTETRNTVGTTAWAWHYIDIDISGDAQGDHRLWVQISVTGANLDQFKATAKVRCMSPRHEVLTANVGL